VRCMEKGQGTSATLLPGFVDVIMISNDNGMARLARDERSRCMAFETLLISPLKLLTIFEKSSWSLALTSIFVTQRQAGVSQPRSLKTENKRPASASSKMHAMQAM